MYSRTLVAALASFASLTDVVNSAALASPAPTVVTQALFGTLKYFASFTAASTVALPCPKPPYGTVIQAYINTGSGISQTNVHATLFRDTPNKRFILAWAGSNNTANVISNFDASQVSYSGCSGCFVHTGFLDAYNSARSQVVATLNSAFSQYPGYSLTLSGVSLGGALANLNFADLYPSKPPYTINAIYTYGEPRVGNPQYATYIDTLSKATDTTTNPGIYYRVTHDVDIVPKLPSTTFGSFIYQHSRHEYWEKNGTNNVAPTAATTIRCYGGEPTNCNNAAVGTVQQDFDAHGSYVGFRPEGLCQ